MSSTGLKGDTIAFFTEHGNRILAIGTVLVAGALLLGLLGFGNVLGGVFFLGYGLVWLAVVGFVLWMLYRLVLALERVADAQERIASAQFQAGVAEHTGTGGSESEDGGDDDK